jgi:uncharacterized protein (DUF58 family)
MSGNTAKIRAIVLVVPIALLVLALIGGHVLVWRLFSLSVLVLLFSYLWARLGLRGIEGQVKNSCEHCQAGESFDEEAVIRNVSALPKLLIRVWKDSELPGHTNQLAINLPPRGSHYWRTEVHCGLRGQYSLGPLVVEATDPFGLFKMRRNLGNDQSLLVYPATVELSLFPLISHGESGSALNYWLTSGPGGTVSRVREYVPGDSLGHVHWRSTAHAGKLMVKDFSRELSKSIWIVLDMSKASLAGDGTGSVEENCVTIAASLVKKYLDSGRPVGLITEGDDFYLFPPEVGHEHFWRVMKALALVRAEGEVPISRLIERERKHLRGDSFFVVITASASDVLATCLRHMNSQDTTAVVIAADTVNRYDIARRLASGGIPAYAVK